VKPERFESLAPLVTQVLAGERSKVRSRIKGKKSPRLQVMRIWITLQQWSEQEPGEARDRLITHLEHRLRQQLAPDLKIGRPEPSAKPRKEERPKVLTVNPLDVLAATLTAESMPSVETLVTQINALRRARDVFRWIDGAPSLSHERIVAVLQAMHQVVPEGSRVLEGTTLAVRRLCLAGEHEGLMRCLTEGHEAVRYGGEGLDGVLTLAKASLNAGWSLSRVLRGTTRRERRDSEVLAAIGVGADEIWRLVFIKGEQKGEVVTFSALSPEGRAALPQLLLTARNRVVVMSGEPELQEWYGTCGGPEPLTSGQEEAVVAQMTGWA
jgi:hypothetical protein